MLGWDLMGCRGRQAKWFRASIDKPDCVRMMAEGKRSASQRGVIHDKLLRYFEMFLVISAIGVLVWKFGSGIETTADMARGAAQEATLNALKSAWSVAFTVKHAPPTAAGVVAKLADAKCSARGAIITCIGGASANGSGSAIFTVTETDGVVASPEHIEIDATASRGAARKATLNALKMAWAEAFAIKQAPPTTGEIAARIADPKCASAVTVSCAGVSKSDGSGRAIFVLTETAGAVASPRDIGISR